jgi:N-acetylmuramic acid 6-phosphate etherase
MVLTNSRGAAYTRLVEPDHLVTEARREGAAELDLASTRELVELMNAEHATVPRAVAGARDAIAAAADEIAGRLRAGGRLILVGAGTSGALARAEADECTATFSTPPEQVVAVAAGATAGSSAERSAAEDDAGAGRDALQRLNAGANDFVVLVSASGRTPYVLGAAAAARDAGARTACVVSTEGSELASLCDLAITVVVGPEVLAGSTRLKAGTAQKLVLNTLTTVAMIRLGKTYAGLMVDVEPANDKLRARVRSIVAAASGAAADEIEAALEAAGGETKVAILSLLGGMDADTARARLVASGGNIRLALIR